MSIQTEQAFPGGTFEERLHMAMWRARLTPPKLGKLIGVSGQTVRNWQDAEHTATPSFADVLAYAVACDVPVELLDPDHPQAGLRWSYRGPDDTGDPLDLGGSTSSRLDDLAA